MSSEDTATNSQIASDVLPPLTEEPAVPAELNTIFAWHRPRKQYIREKQWVALSEVLITKLVKAGSFSGQDGVRYLTLPGIDYFDVSMLADSCKQLGIPLTSIGFLAEKERNSLAARAQVREQSLINRGKITNQSYTFLKKFEEISSGASSTFKDLKERGPFHIVNIDACGSIAPSNASHSQRTIDAIYRLIEYQLSVCNHRWLLFVTADVRFDGFSTHTFENLTNAILENARTDAAFERLTIDTLNGGKKTLRKTIEVAKASADDRYIKLFSLGFSKWILHLALEKQWRLKVHKSYYYSTTSHGDERPTMPSLAFEFVPPKISLNDKFFVTNSEPTPDGIDENLSIRAVNKVSAMADLDQMIAGDTTLANEMLINSKANMMDAGYAAIVVDSLK